MKKKKFGIVLGYNGEELLDEILANDEEEALYIFIENHHEFYKDECHLYCLGKAPYIVTDTVNLITAFAY